MIRLIVMVVVWVAAVALVLVFLAGAERLRHWRQAQTAPHGVPDRPGERHKHTLKGVGGDG